MEPLHWYALSVYRNKVFEAREQLAAACADTYIPVVRRATSGQRIVDEPAVSRLMFIRTDETTALNLEKEAASNPRLASFYIFRNVSRTTIQPIGDNEMHMFMLVSSMGEQGLDYLSTAQSADYSQGDRVRVTEGPFKGAEGYVRRVKKNRRVIVEIQGVCAIALPYIHREFLEKVD